MSAKTDPDTGFREYEIEGLGWVHSLTTLLKTYPKHLEVAAGKLGVERTHELAVSLVKEYAAGALKTIDATLLLEDFDYWLGVKEKETFGTYKNGSVKPPHIAAWAMKADTGTAIHHGIERWAKLAIGKNDAPASMLHSDVFQSLGQHEQAQATQAMQNFLVWVAENNAVPLASEEIAYLRAGEMGAETSFACRIDLELMVNGNRLILDAKSGKLDKGKPYKEQMVQTEMQRRARSMRTRVVVEDAGILHVPADGGKVKMFTALDMGLDRDHLLRTFNACAELFVCVNGEPTGGA